jgi:hypothetical protein
VYRGEDTEIARLYDLVPFAHGPVVIGIDGKPLLVDTLRPEPRNSDDLAECGLHRVSVHAPILSDDPMGLGASRFINLATSGGVAGVFVERWTITVLEYGQAQAKIDLIYDPAAISRIRGGRKLLKEAEGSGVSRLDRDQLQVRLPLAGELVQSVQIVSESTCGGSAGPMGASFVSFKATYSPSEEASDEEAGISAWNPQNQRFDLLHPSLRSVDWRLEMEKVDGKRITCRWGGVANFS